MYLNGVKRHQTMHSDHLGILFVVKFFFADLTSEKAMQNLNCTRSSIFCFVTQLKWKKKTSRIAFQTTAQRLKNANIKLCQKNWFPKQTDFETKLAKG